MKQYYLINRDSNYISAYKEIASALLIEKKSKFYSYVFNITSEEDALEYIKTVKKENKEARHVVYVYAVIQNNVRIVRFDEDSEPQNTATKSMVDLFEKENIINTCVVIVRYFGGILLGAGPLTRAYLKVGKEAINKCQKLMYHDYIEYSFICNYSLFDKISKGLEKYFEEEVVRIKNIDFLENINYVLEIDKEKYDEILNFLKEYFV